jgi:PAS domain S-box-containing protein
VQALLKSRQIAVRLGISFSALLAILIAVGWMGLNQMEREKANLEEIQGKDWAQLTLAQEALRYSGANSRITMQLFLLQDEEQIKAMLITRAENTKKIGELLDKVEELCDTDEEKKLVTAIKASRQPYVASYMRALHLLLDERNGPEAARIMAQETTPALFKYHAAYNDLLHLEVGQIEKAIKERGVQQAGTRRLVLTSIVLSVALTGIIALITTRRMVAETTAQLTNYEKIYAELQGSITQRERAGEQLRLQSAALESAANAIIITDARGTMQWVNPAFTHITEYSFEEAIGKNPSILKSGKQDESFYQNLWITILAGKVWVGEIANRKKGGQFYTEEMTIAPVRSLTGEITNFVAIKQDVTERKRVEAALRQSEEKFRDLAENIPEVFFVLAPDPLRTAYISPAYDERGRPGQALYEDPRGWIEAIHQEDRERVEINFARCLQGDRIDMEYRVVRPDGSIRHLHARAVPVLNAEGKPSRIVGLAEDITLRKNAEKAQRESDEQLRLLLESTAEAIYGVDLGGDCIFCNASCVRMLGYGSSAELLGKNMHRLMHHSLADGTSLPDEACRIYQAFRVGKGAHVDDEVLWRKDGSCFPAEYWSYPIQRDGKSIGSVATFFDITERKRAEAELVKAKEAAEAANRAKSEFLANMSHEIRTPMNGILGMTGLLLETELSPEQEEYLHMVNGSADALLTLLNDILDFSKMEAGKLELDCLSFNLRKSLGEVVKTLAIKAQQKDLEFIFDIHPEVPTSLSGDPARLRQVLVNLVGNSIKFTERGEIEVNVRTEAQSVEGTVLRLSVRDTGTGIPLDKQLMIFDAFSQADSSTTRKYGGTGLGLTISAQLVGLMGGKIWIESEVGKGSTFHFTIRVGSGVAEVAPESPDVSQLAGEPILVVDDNSTNRRILRDSVLRWKMKPTVVESAAAALQVLQRCQASNSPLPVVLTDAHMPEIDGFGLVERIRQDPLLSNGRIVMLTSGGQRGDAARCQKLGVAAYLSKPFDRLELREILLRVLTGDAAKPKKRALVTRHTVREQEKSLSFLVAEDNAVNQRLIARLLEKRGHRVVLAQNGREALEALEKQPFDIVLMDGQMPEMDGFEATKLIREKEKASGTHLPIIALTAHAMKGDKERCLAEGMDGYVSKPLKLEELITVIEKVVPGITRRQDATDLPSQQTEAPARK